MTYQKFLPTHRLCAILLPITWLLSVAVFCPEWSGISYLSKYVRSGILNETGGIRSQRCGSLTVQYQAWISGLWFLLTLIWPMNYLILTMIAFFDKKYFLILCPYKLLLGKYAEDVKVTKLSQPITAQHVRIDPQYWERGLCMKMDLLGCEARTSGNAINSRIISKAVYVRSP